MKAHATLTLLLAATLLAPLGCSTTVIDPGTQTSATYRFGKLTAQEQKSMDAVYAATEKAMEDLGLNVIQKVKDQLEAEVIARDAQDKKVRIELVAVTRDTTKLVVHIRSVEKARRIYQTIQGNIQ